MFDVLFPDTAPYTFEVAADDQFARRCDHCARVVGRFGVMPDENGLRHVVWWPQREWDGIEGSFRCTEHSTLLERRPKLPMIVRHACGHRRFLWVDGHATAPETAEMWKQARETVCGLCAVFESFEH